MSDQQEPSALKSLGLPALGIFLVLGALLAVMLMSDREYGPGKAYLNQNVGDQVYNKDPGEGRASGVQIGESANDAEDEKVLSADDQLKLAESMADRAEILEGAPACENHCDCQGGKVCAPEAGQCVAVFVDIFCCDSAPCPENATCVTAEGQPQRCEE